MCIRNIWSLLYICNLLLSLPISYTVLCSFPRLENISSLSHQQFCCSHSQMLFFVLTLGCCCSLLHSSADLLYPSSTDDTCSLTQMMSICSLPQLLTTCSLTHLLAAQLLQPYDRLRKQSWYTIILLIFICLFISLIKPCLPITRFIIWSVGLCVDCICGLLFCCNTWVLHIKCLYTLNVEYKIYCYVFKNIFIDMLDIMVLLSICVRNI